jgi:ligand-binding sensor domain-containing protein/two-component sensor histidine kinase
LGVTVRQLSGHAVSSRLAPGLLSALLFASPTAALALRIESADAEAVPYSRHVWSSTDGLPEDLAQAITETPDGYLWIGTSGGLVRFDGSRFTVFNHENEAAFGDDSVYSLYTSKDGTLWAGTEGGGLVRYQRGVFHRFGAEQGLTNAFVRVIFEDHLGRRWIGTDAGLFRMEGETFERIDGRSGLPAILVHSICEDREGRLLVGGRGLLVLCGREAAYYSSSESMADNSIRTIRQTADGSVWIGTISGLRCLRSGIRGNPFRSPKTIDSANISVLLEGRGGELWIGTYGRGMMRYRSGRMDRFSAPSWLPHNNVIALFEDREGNVWVGTRGGLLRLSPCAATTITTSDGAPLNINTISQDRDGTLFVAALNGRLFQVSGQTLVPVSLPLATSGLRIRNVFRDSTGALWIGTDGQGVIRLLRNRAVRYSIQQGLVNDFVRAFCEQRDGSIWIGTDDGLSRWHAGRFQSFTTESGLIYGSVRALLVDRNDRLWVATDEGLSRFESGVCVTDPLLNRVQGHKVWALHEDPAGGLWIGTQGAGLFFAKDGKLFQFTTQEGLPSNKIHFITEDRHANLWMSGPSGIVSISRSDLEALPRDPARPLAVRLYTTSEGLRTNEMNGGVQPAGVLASTGELWFPGIKGAVRVTPNVPDQGGPPPVLIEQVIADDRAVSFEQGLLLPPGEGKLEIRYTAIRLQSPERIHFKYWMEGFDREWTAAGQRRVAYYTNLPAGRYRFHVVAYELNAPHNASEKILDLEWRPPFYRTWWFLALCGILAASVAWGSYWLHLRNIRRRFAAVLEERSRLAREMHDTLIQGCLGVSTLLEAVSGAQAVSPQLSTELLDRARSEVRSTVDEARMAIWNLRHGAANNRKLVQAVSQLAKRVASESSVAVGFESDGPARALDAEVERSLTVLVREALQNAVRHAAPKHVSVRLRFERKRLTVAVTDDGCGFDTSASQWSNGHHYGLIGMQERVEKLGGTLDIRSAPGKGTEVSLSIPVAGSASRLDDGLPEASHGSQPQDSLS